jgi:hypothetical protein
VLLGGKEGLSGTWREYDFNEQQETCPGGSTDRPQLPSLEAGLSILPLGKFLVVG